MTILLFLSSGLFLGWSLGANDAANVFGAAVGSRMIRFRTAAILCGIFVVLGATWGGAGATHTLGALGAVDALAGSFMVALAAALTVYWMSRLSLPVSTSQAIVGAIIGWNLFSGTLTDRSALVKIVLTWVACPLLAGVFAAGLHALFSAFFRRAKIHLLRLDAWTRAGLIAVGIFGAYSLGANNIANVMGVFVAAVRLPDLSLGGLLTVGGAQQLFLLGSLAIAAGVATYSRRVMETVGRGLLPLSPESALTVVLANALVLFLFSSQSLESWLLSHGLPAIPLVPVSSTQAVVGAVIGIGLLKGGRGLRFGVLGEIAAGWIVTPLIAGVLSFVALFFLQNVFQQQVYQPRSYRIDAETRAWLSGEAGVSPPLLDPAATPSAPLLDPAATSSKPVLDSASAASVPLLDPAVSARLAALDGTTFDSEAALDRALREAGLAGRDSRLAVIHAAELGPFRLVPDTDLARLGLGGLPASRADALQALAGRSFAHAWQLEQALAEASPAWNVASSPPDARADLARQLRAVCEALR